MNLADDEKACPCCRHHMHRMGETVTEQLHIEVKAKVLQNVRFKYACRHCDRTGINTPVVIAPMPTQPLPDSIATASTLAFALVHKYVDGTPLYRLAQAFERAGVPVSRGALGHWVIGSSERHLASHPWRRDDGSGAEGKESRGHQHVIYVGLPERRGQARDAKPDKGETPDQCIRRFRQQHSIPALNALKEWLDKIAPKVLPDSMLGDAVSYTLNQWEYLTRYAEDGRMPIDNNLLERDIRIVATGRKKLAVQRHRRWSQGQCRRLQSDADLPRPTRRAVSLVAPRPHRIASARRRRRYHRPAALQLPQNCHRRLIQRDAFRNQAPKGGVKVRGKSRLPMNRATARIIGTMRFMNWLELVKQREHDADVLQQSA